MGLKELNIESVINEFLDSINSTEIDKKVFYWLYYIVKDRQRMR
jgi:hypothetical protein